MIHELLTSIGLSDKEATVYVALLRYGTQRISFIASKASLNRGTTYVILHALLAKGLVVKSTKKKVQCFTALEPKHLLHYLDHKKETLLSQREKLSEALGQLLAITNPNTARPTIEFFDGPEGARAALEDTLTASDRILRAFLSIGDIAETIGERYFDTYTTRRIKAGYALHALRTLEKDKKAMERNIYARRYVTSKKDKREVRYVGDELAFPISLYMYDNKLAIISSREENFALIIESKELAEMQKKLFSLLWHAATPLPKGKGR